MNNLFDHSDYRVIKFILQTLGLWPYQSFSTKVIILSLVLFDLISISIPMVRNVIENFTNTRELVNCLPELVVTLIAYGTLISSVVNAHKIKKIVEFMKSTWDNLIDTEEKIIFKKYAKISGLATTIISGVAFTACILFISVPLISKGLDSIFKPNDSHSMENILKGKFYNLDPEEHYIWINLYETQFVFVCVTMAVSYPLFFLVIINHACSMFAILSHKIRNIDRLKTGIRNSMSDNELDKALSNKIKACIRYHWDCIRFSQLIEDSSTYLWLMEVFCNACMITIMSVQSMVNLHKPMYFISFSVNAVGTVIWLCCINFASQRLLDYSEQLKEIIYNVDWYEFPPRSKKLLCIMLLNASQSCKITAGGMIDLNMETFCGLMKMSASYFTFVLSTQD